MVLSLIFIVDICFTFNTAYLEAHLEGDVWVIDRRMIATKYLQGRFFIEALGAYPAELADLIWAVSAGYSADAVTSHLQGDHVHVVAEEQVAVLRAMRLLRLLRCAQPTRHFACTHPMTAGAPSQFVRVRRTA